MSSDEGYIQSLAQAQKNVFKFGEPILMIIGTISCTMNLIVFLKKNLRKNPCSIYLVAYNISNLLLICTTLFFSILATGYNIAFLSFSYVFNNAIRYIGLNSPFKYHMYERTRRTAVATIEYDESSVYCVEDALQ